MRQSTKHTQARLADLPVPAKVTLTLFLLLIGGGYLVALGNIYFQHNEADLEAGLTLNDLKRTYHGLEKRVSQDTPILGESEMLHEVRPGGAMRKYLEEGGPPAVDALIGWLEAGAPEEDFTKGELSPQTVIANQCIRCHNATDGDMRDLPYARSAADRPEFLLVSRMAVPEVVGTEEGEVVMALAPTSTEELVHITHAHILSIPIFTLVMAALFFMTNVPSQIKFVLGPLPMLAICADFAAWWLARSFEPFVFVIGAAGAVFGASFGLQILCVFVSTWFGRRSVE